MALGGTLLVACVLLGAISQAGLVMCAVCNGNVCGPGTEVCPDSLAAVGVFLAALSIAAVMLALGLGRPQSASRPGPRSGETTRAGTMDRRTISEFLAPFLTFFGWGVLAWGLLLPWNVFGFCHEPCVYPYQLQGIPLMLATSGAVMLVLGASVYGLLWRAQRVGTPA